MIIRESYTQLVLFLALLLCFPSGLSARTRVQTSPAKEAAIAKVVQLLQDSGLTHRKTGQNTWVIQQPGKSTMLVAAGTEFVVLGIIVAVKKNIRVTPDLSFKLLKLNHSLDYTKAGFDDDDDLFVRTEVRLRMVDAQEFKKMVEDVFSSADKARAEVTPFLITP